MILRLWIPQLFDIEEFVIQVCQGRVLDYKRKFIEAASRYNELSYKTAIHERSVSATFSSVQPDFICVFNTPSYAAPQIPHCQNVVPRTFAMFAVALTVGRSNHAYRFFSSRIDNWILGQIGTVHGKVDTQVLFPFVLSDSLPYHLQSGLHLAEWWRRSSQAVRAFDCQCKRWHCLGINPPRHWNMRGGN